MSNYVNGRRKEYDTLRILREEGYIAFRTAGSHGIWDVLAYKDGHWRVIQVKYKCKPSIAEWMAVKAEIVPSNTRKEVWIWVSGKKEPEIVSL